MCFLMLTIDPLPPNPFNQRQSETDNLRHILFSMNDCVDNRPFSPESVLSDIQDRPITVVYIRHYKPLSPEAMVFLQNTQLNSPKSLS